MRLAICDGEIESIVEYKQILAEIMEKNGIPVTMSVYSNCSELKFAFEENEKGIDVLFIDINMSEISGIEMAQWVREKGILCEVIFLTASRTQKHILQAFDVDAFHYVIKRETSLEKLEEICVRVAQKVDKRTKEVITMSCAGESRMIPIQNILYFEVRNYIITVYYENEEKFEFYSTLGKIENVLIGRGFVRVHRSYLVNWDQVRLVSRKEIELSKGKTIPIGRKYADELAEMIKERDKVSTGIPTRKQNTVGVEA